jgi:hypothetical protein
MKLLLIANLGKQLRGSYLTWRRSPCPVFDWDMGDRDWAESYAYSRPGTSIHPCHVNCGEANTVYCVGIYPSNSFA